MRGSKIEGWQPSAEFMVEFEAPFDEESSKPGDADAVWLRDRLSDRRMYGPCVDGPRLWSAEQRRLWKDAWGAAYSQCSTMNPVQAAICTRAGYLAVARARGTFYGVAGQRYTRESLPARGW